MIGREAREQVLEAEGRLPEVAVACVGGGSNAIGMFSRVRRRRRRAPDRRRGARRREPRDRPDGSAPRLALVRPRRRGRPGARRRSRSRPGSTTPASAPSTPRCATPAAPSTSPLTDEEALAAFRRLARTEGIVPALEPSHALARVAELDEELVLLCLSGRGDKDLAEVLAR